MIDQNHDNNQLPNEMKAVFSELNIFKHLRQAGITKTFGFTCSHLFRIIFCLIFQHKNWFLLLDSKKAEGYPAKDAVYRFLNQSTFNWRRFLLLFSASTIKKVDSLTDHTRPKVFILQGKKSILRSIHCVMANGTPAKIVFIQNRNKKSE